MLVPPPNVPVARWHVSPWLDVLGYHWSWVPPLLILLTLGDRFPIDYRSMLLIVLALNFAHQAISLPFVYLDSEVFRSERRRFTVGPLLLLAMFLPTLFFWKVTIPRLSLDPSELLVGPAILLLLIQLDAVLRDDRPLSAGWLWSVTAVLLVAPGLHVLMAGNLALFPAGPILLTGSALVSVALTMASRRRRDADETPSFRARVAEIGIPIFLSLAAAGAWFPVAAVPLVPARAVRVRDLLVPVSMLSYVWNFWHIYMQKYGILRLYAAKSGAAPNLRPPGWVDRLLVFAWLPLFFALVGPINAEFIFKRYKDMRSVTVPLLGFLADHAIVLVPLTSLVVVVAAAAFVHHEQRSSGLKNAPRLSAAAGFFLLSASFLVVDPVKAAIAFGFTHTIEYFVFVWAWQRKKYAQPASHRPLIGPAMRQPALAVVGFMVGAGLLWYVAGAWGRDWGKAHRPPSPLGLTPGQWLSALGPFLAMSHFYFDGFLWKMRKAAVRANL